MDPSNSPAFPTDHPFLGVQSALYWSATSKADNPTDASVVDFFTGFVGYNVKSDDHLVWCVRGGQSFAGNTHSTLH